MNKYLHAVGWKRDGKWDRVEVLVDYSVCVSVLLIMCVVL